MYFGYGGRTEFTGMTEHDIAELELIYDNRIRTTTIEEKSIYDNFKFSSKIKGLSAHQKQLKLRIAKKEARFAAVKTKYEIKYMFFQHPTKEMSFDATESLDNHRKQKARCTANTRNLLLARALVLGIPYKTFESNSLRPQSLINIKSISNIVKAIDDILLCEAYFGTVHSWMTLHRRTEPKKDHLTFEDKMELVEKWITA